MWLPLLWVFVLCICIVSKRGKYASNVSTHHHTARGDGHHLNCIGSTLMLCLTSILCCFTSCFAKQTAHYLLRLLTTNTLITTFFFTHTTHARRSSGRLSVWAPLCVCVVCVCKAHSTEYIPKSTTLIHDMYIFMYRECVWGECVYIRCVCVYEEQCWCVLYARKTGSTQHSEWNC